MARKKVDWKEIEDPVKKFKAYQRSEEWKEIARLVRERDHNKCMCCGRNEKQATLSIHHNTYEHWGNEKEHLEDLICCCQCCHRMIHMNKANISRFRKPK